MSVIIYSTPTCGNCKIAKKYFNDNDISYTEYNVMTDPAKAGEMIEKSGQRRVPVIDINGSIIIGFCRTEIEKALKV